MKLKNIGYWTREDKLFRNNYFDPDNNLIDLDQNAVQNQFVTFGYECNNKNILIRNLNLVDDISKLDLLIVSDFPGIKRQSKLLKEGMKCSRKILILEENPSVYPATWDASVHNLFDYVLTAHDDIIDNKKYFKFNWPSFSTHQNLFPLKKKSKFHNKKFSCMISWNKFYKKKTNVDIKINLIRWFEENHPNSFDLFGPNWNEKVFSYQNPFTKYFNERYFKSFRKLLGQNFISWKGGISAEDKKKIINNYKFIFVIENSSDYNGYMTDKIFEAFFSGSVPIYLGPSNIEKYIPNNCFIDYRNFKDLRELYSFLTSINKNVYDDYLINIHNYLESNESKFFSEAQLCKNLFKVLNLY